MKTEHLTEVNNMVFVQPDIVNQSNNSTMVYNNEKLHSELNFLIKEHADVIQNDIANICNQYDIEIEQINSSLECSATNIMADVNNIINDQYCVLEIFNNTFKEQHNILDNFNNKINVQATNFRTEIEVIRKQQQEAVLEQINSSMACSASSISTDVNNKINEGILYLEKKVMIELNKQSEMLNNAINAQSISLKKQIVVLEEKINDALNMRTSELEKNTLREDHVDKYEKNKLDLKEQNNNFHNEDSTIHKINNVRLGIIQPQRRLQPQTMKFLRK